jgi:hypothetical protein
MERFSRSKQSPENHVKSLQEREERIRKALGEPIDRLQGAIRPPFLPAWKESDWQGYISDTSDARTKFEAIYQFTEPQADSVEGAASKRKQCARASLEVRKSRTTHCPIVQTRHIRGNNCEILAGCGGSSAICSWSRSRA